MTYLNSFFGSFIDTVTLFFSLRSFIPISTTGAFSATDLSSSKVFDLPATNVEFSSITIIEIYGSSSEISNISAILFVITEL